MITETSGGHSRTGTADGDKHACQPHWRAGVRGVRERRARSSRYPSSSHDNHDIMHHMIDHDHDHDNQTIKTSKLISRDVVIHACQIDLEIMHAHMHASFCMHVLIGSKNACACIHR